MLFVSDSLAHAPYVVLFKLMQFGIQHGILTLRILKPTQINIMTHV